jgi:SHS2 domain-containing protein
MGYQEIEHTGDYAIRVWADNLPTLFTDAARGLYQVSGARVGTGPRIERPVSLRADDIEGLLVAFLSELIYLQEDSGLGFQEFDLDVRQHRLTGTMMGGDLTTIAQPLKAVTYHDLAIEHTGSQYSCEVVFDA